MMCVYYMLLQKNDYFTAITANSVHCACLRQITATSSKVTTISNWKTAAWRLSSWARSQRTGSVVEHFQNVSQLANSCDDIWPHEDIAVVSHTTCGAHCSTLHVSVGDMFLPACITSLQLCRKAPRDLTQAEHRQLDISYITVWYWHFICYADADFYYNLYPLFYCFIVFFLFVF